MNAAWGQAVLLLHTVGKAAGADYAPYTLRPLGSQPRVTVAGQQADLELWGPVSLFRQARYDRAQVAVLGCLKRASDALEAAAAQREAVASGGGGDVAALRSERAHV